MLPRRLAFLVAVLAAALGAAAPPSARAQAPVARRRPQSREASCRRFVQRFYDRYLAFAKKEHREASCDLIVQQQPALFSRELRRRLSEDSAASAKVPGEIVGLDFDPFLNAQDFADRYVVRRVHREGQHYLADVYTIIGGESHSHPWVVPELVPRGRSWTFVNFRYPGEHPDEKTDLLTVLQKLREDRKKDAR